MYEAPRPFYYNFANVPNNPQPFYHVSLHDTPIFFSPLIAIFASFRLSNIMVNRLTIDLRSFFVVENATVMPTVDNASVPMPPRQKRSRVTLKFTSPSRTALSSAQFTSVGMDLGKDDYTDHDPRDTKMQTISEQSGRSESVDLQEYEMQKLRKDGHPGV